MATGVQLSITSPTSNSTVGTSFDVSGGCTQSHVITVKILNTNYVNTPTASGGRWSTTFAGVPAGTYSIEASCGTPPDVFKVTVTGITVSQ